MSEVPTKDFVIINSTDTSAVDVVIDGDNSANNVTINIDTGGTSSVDKMYIADYSLKIKQ